MLRRRRGRQAGSGGWAGGVREAGARTSAGKEPLAEDQPVAAAAAALGAAGLGPALAQRAPAGCRGHAGLGADRLLGSGAYSVRSGSRAPHRFQLPLWCLSTAALSSTTPCLNASASRHACSQSLGFCRGAGGRGRTGVVAGGKAGAPARIQWLGRCSACEVGCSKGRSRSGASLRGCHSYPSQAALGRGASWAARRVAASPLQSPATGCRRTRPWPACRGRCC
jgi:hypothetical protein